MPCPDWYAVHLSFSLPIALGSEAQLLSDSPCHFVMYLVIVATYGTSPGPFMAVIAGPCGPMGNNSQPQLTLRLHSKVDNRWFRFALRPPFQLSLVNVSRQHGEIGMSVRAGRRRHHPSPSVVCCAKQNRTD
ncbi:hypothetical protein B0H63DRAFT_230959 [Podospora didyma]|uniref:Uncharacterized protein n=1 Tax=Podospora didyma TaxID=330526 RepID=A0AAE0NCT7_9PEZI|nr:hypothetical protein B0H63DRAFT_230959 [Podospora didyma]